MAVGTLGTKVAFASYTAGQAFAERVAKERGYTDEQAKKLRGVLAGADLVAAKGAMGLGEMAHLSGGVLAGLTQIPLASSAFIAYSALPGVGSVATYRAAKGVVKDAIAGAKTAAAGGTAKVGGALRRVIPERPPRESAQKKGAPPFRRLGLEALSARNEWMPIGSSASAWTPVSNAIPRLDPDSETPVLDDAAHKLIADNLESHEFDDWYIALLSAALDEGQGVEEAIQTANDAYRENPEAPDVHPAPDDEDVIFEEEGSTDQGGKTGPIGGKELASNPFPPSIGSWALVDNGWVLVENAEGHWVTTKDDQKVFIGGDGGLRPGGPGSPPVEKEGKETAEKPEPPRGPGPTPVPPRTVPIPPPSNQTEILGKIRHETQNRDLSDAMRELSGTNLYSVLDQSGVSKSVLKQFEAHGVNTLSALTGLLNGGIDPKRPFFTENLGSEKGGYRLLKDNSPFVVISHPQQSMVKGGMPAVLVDRLHEPNIKDLEKSFPGVRFFPAHQAASILSKVAAPMKTTRNSGGTAPTENWTPVTENGWAPVNDSSWTVDDFQEWLTANNCGTGAGGFQPGNSCAGGGGGGSGGGTATATAPKAGGGLFDRLKAALGLGPKDAGSAEGQKDFADGYRSSQAVKDLLEGKSEHNLHSKIASSVADTMLTEIMNEVGRGGKPKSATSAEIDELGKKGWYVAYRGIGEQKYADQFKNGPLYNGAGSYGNGNYFTYAGRARPDAEARKGAAMYASQNASDGKGAVVRMAFPPGAKIVDHAQVLKEQSAFFKKNNDDLFAGKITKEQHQKLQNLHEDVGRFAALKNYDAVRVPHEGFLLVLNRSKVVVEK